MGRGRTTRAASTSASRRPASGPLAPIPMRTHASPLRSVKYWFDAGEITMDQSYQRGHVWSEEQQLALVKSILQRIPIGAVYLNRRNEADDAGYYVVDGKQRLSAINAFLTGKVRFPAVWVAADHIAGAPDAHGNISLDDLEAGFRRALAMDATFAVHETHLPDEAAERELFDRINFTGTPMTDADRAKA